MTGGKKKIKSGKQFNRYFAPSKQQTIEMPQAGVMTTLEYMQKLVTATLHQTKKISKVLKGKNTLETSRNIWHFLYENIQYKMDEAGIEQLREPNRSWTDRKTGIDCDCFSIFASSILTNLGIPHALRITKYNGNNDYQHVYVVVQNNIIIDPVVDSFNYQKQFSGKHDKQMEIRHQFLAGVNAPAFGQEFNYLNGPSFGNEFDFLSGLGNVNPQEVKNKLVDATRLNLENTLRILEKNPSLISLTEANPHNYIKQIKFVLQNWNNPQTRLAAIDKVIAMESGIGGLNGWSLKNAWNAVKGAATTVSNAVKSAAEKAAEAARAAAAAVVKYNPVSLAIRGGLLLAFKINLFHMTEKLKWGYLTEAQATQRGFNITQWRKVKDTVGKVENAFVKIGGKRETIKDAILKGKNGGLGVVATATTTAAASGVIATIVSWLKNIDFKALLAKVKNDPELVNKLTNAYNTAKTVFSKPNVNIQTIPVGPSTAPIAPTGANIDYDVDLPAYTVTADAPKKEGSKLLVPALIIGGLVLGGLALKNKKPALSGVQAVAI
jgi:hypothetical protein